MKTIRISKWQDFQNYINSDKQPFPHYWRGQRDPSWPLASSFERMVLASKGGDKQGASQRYPYDMRIQVNKSRWADYYKSLRDRYLGEFIYASSGLRGPNPKELSTDEWWALGRHHGLITPLLDWTEKPYIASFFALTDMYSQWRKNGSIALGSNDIAVYRLTHNAQLEGDGLRVISVAIDELTRIHGQRGLFTWLDSNKYFELEGFLDNTKRGHLLTQFILESQCVIDGLKDLDAHGIDYRLLFPDLAGAALAANSKVDFSFISAR